VGGAVYVVLGFVGWGGFSGGGRGVVYGGMSGVVLGPPFVRFGGVGRGAGLGVGTVGHPHDTQAKPRVSLAKKGGKGGDYLQPPLSL